MNDTLDLQTTVLPMTSGNPPSSDSVQVLPTPMKKVNTSQYLRYGLFGLIFTFLLIILIIVAVIVSKVNSLTPIPIETISSMSTASSSLSTTTTSKKEINNLVDSIMLEQMLVHLRQFESRALGTAAFNRTVDYLISQLTEANMFTIQKYYLPVPRTELNGYPFLLALPNASNISLFTYPKDFVPMQRSNEARNWSISDGKPLSVVANYGCTLDDWNQTKEGDVALVRRGICTFVEKILFAMSKKASACLVYNDGLTVERFAPLNNTRAPRNNTIPALFLSYGAGMRLILENITRIYLRLEFRAVPPAIVTNVCADTKTGDPKRTIVVGSHSDSVAAGPGLNDNGSGMAGTLAIALNLARLFRQSDYPSWIRSRLKFCWWGGEEEGLLGSTEFVRQAKADGSLAQYSVNLNFDMLASPNFIFGIYDGKTANNATTPTRALPGSNRITRLFVDYFEQNRLPWDYTEFSGRSDYGPFLAEGIACGGLFSGADDVKTQEQRDRYSKTLGAALGGMANADLDPCYHQKCDTLENLNTFAYLHMVKAAARSIEYLAQLQDLNKWLYPD